MRPLRAASCPIGRDSRFSGAGRIFCKDQVKRRAAFETAVGEARGMDQLHIGADMIELCVLAGDHHRAGIDNRCR